MNDDQHDRLRSYTAVETVLDAHPDALAHASAAAVAIADFRAKLADLRAAVKKQDAYAAQGKAKDALRLALTDLAEPVSQAVAAWAEDEGDVALADQIAFTRTDFLHGHERTALDRADLVHDTAAAHADTLVGYGVEKADLDALDDAIEAFGKALGQPRHAIAERRAQTKAIERLFPEVERVLERRLDRFVAKLRGTPFYDEYHAARRVGGR